MLGFNNNNTKQDEIPIKEEFENHLRTIKQQAVPQPEPQSTKSIPLKGKIVTYKALYINGNLIQQYKISEEDVDGNLIYNGGN